MGPRSVPSKYMPNTLALSFGSYISLIVPPPLAIATPLRISTLPVTLQTVLTSKESSNSSKNDKKGKILAPGCRNLEKAKQRKACQIHLSSPKRF